MTFPLIIIAALAVIIIGGAIMEIMEANADSADDAIGFTYDDDEPDPHDPDVEAAMNPHKRLNDLLSAFPEYAERMRPNTPLHGHSTEFCEGLIDVILREQKAKKNRHSNNGRPPRLEIQK